MAKKEITSQELVESHKPKNFKYKYIFTDETLLEDLMNSGYDMSTLDTICDDKLVDAALSTGVIISKKMVTKADKKLLGVYVGFFHYKSHHVVIKLQYERFDIIEIFNLI